VRLKTPLKLGFKPLECIYAMEVTDINPGGYRQEGSHNWSSRA
jgi:hypothetical protein